MERVEVTFEDDVAADLAAYARGEQLPTSAAAERLLGRALDRRRRDRLVDRVADGELTVGEAADRAELSSGEIAALLEERGLGRGE